MKYMLVELLKKEDTITSMFGGGLFGGGNTDTANMVKLVGNNIYETVEDVHNFINTEVKEGLQKETDELYEKMKSQPGLYNIKDIDEQIAKGATLVSKNLLILPVTEYIGLQCVPTVNPLGVKNKREIGPDKHICEFNNGKVFYTDGDTVCIAFKTFADAETWTVTNDSDLVFKEFKDTKEFNAWIGESDEDKKTDS